MKATLLRCQNLLAHAAAITLAACGGSEVESPEGTSATSMGMTTSGATTGGDATNGAVSTTASASTSAGETVATTATATGAGGLSGGSVSNVTTGGAEGGMGGVVQETMVTGSSTTGAGGGCTIGSWPEADPAAQGPFTTVTEENVGPTTTDDEGSYQFTMFRPEELGRDGLCHPIVTWGNGTGSNPGLYGVLLRHLASHGFVVIASDSPNVARGDPQPMVAGVSWVIEQNGDPSSVLYQNIDPTHVGATGHSQGGLATTMAGGDSQVTTIAPLCGAGRQQNLSGPALLLCGGMDDIATCDGIEGTFDSISNQPAMFASYLTADHANWITFNGTDISPMETAVVAWMRVQLMADESLRDWFYGADCQLCTDAAWEIRQSMLD